MAKFRKNYERHSGTAGGGIILRVILFASVIAMLLWGYSRMTESDSSLIGHEPVVEDVLNIEQTGEDSIFFLPSVRFGEIIRHKYFALSYAEDFELAEWVAYELTSERLNKKWVKRTDDYRQDTKVRTGSATPEDFRRSGYDRGHLVSAADMAFSHESISETFIMSNISPQETGFNKGVWRELEESTRDWAKRFKHLYIITGPVLTKPPKTRIGENKVAVPQEFYRIILDLREPELKAIAFVIPNEVTDKRLEDFATTVDHVEELTGINFFPNLMPEKLEKKLESSFDTKLWETNEKKYELRVKYWNKGRN